MQYFARHHRLIAVGLSALALLGAWYQGAALARAAEVKSNSPATQPADGPLEPVKDLKALKEFVPFQSRSGAFMLKVGKKPDREIDFHFDAEQNDLWAYTLADKHVTYYKAGKDGGIVIPRELDSNEHVEITYTPAFQMLPANWADSPVYDGTCTMVVKNSKTGLVREKGTCVYRVELLGKQKIHTPAGDFEACLVRETRHIRLNLAKSDVMSLTWYVPGQGEVADHTETTTKALGIIGGKTVEETRLAR